MSAINITIITAVKNSAGSLSETIESVIPFLSNNVNYIIIDGGSDDGTIDIIKQHEPHLKTWVTEADKGVYDAMNKGWMLADDENWILFLGAGDRLIKLPDRRPEETTLNTVLYGNVSLTNNQKFHSRPGLWLKLYNSIHHQALLIPKRIHSDPPFSLEYPLYADFDFNQRLAKKGITFVFCKDIASFAPPDGITRELNLDELQNIILKNYGRFWANLSYLGFKIASAVPLFKRLKPIH